MTGQRFGHLVVTKMLYGFGKHGEAYCECVCDCGNTIKRSSYDLRHNKRPPNCGCKAQEYRLKAASSLRKDLTGVRFGRLTVKAMIFEHGQSTRAVCRCDCGANIEVIATYLTSGETTSCGCYHRDRTIETNTKDFTGITTPYGIRFIQREYQDAKGKWFWRCECFCGREFVALPAKLQSGHTTSCGCRRRSSREDLITTILQEQGIDYIPEYRFEDCKDAKALPFDFYLPTDRVAIEYHGKQHYNPTDFFGGEHAYEIRARHDQIKRKYCAQNNIRLLELPYTLTDEQITQQIQSLFIRRDCNG